MHDSSEIRHCQQPRDVEPQAITDDFAYLNYYPGGTDRPILYRWPICNFAQRTELPAAGHLQVLAVSDDALLFGLHEYDEDSKFLRQISVRLAKHEGAGVQSVAGVSKGGKRLALTATTWKGGFAALDLGEHMTAERIIVYDLVKGEELASIPVRPLNFALDPAISPDGRRVAALAKNTLIIADVP